MQPDPTPPDAISVRRAEPAEIGQLGQIWYDGWHEAHARILPAELTRVRTRESFEDRLLAALPDLAVAGAAGKPVGFCIVKGDELYQLHVRAQARGSGVAAATRRLGSHEALSWRTIFRQRHSARGDRTL